MVIAATAYAGSGPNPNIPVALGGIVAAGVVYASIGLIVHVSGTAWVEKLMPPVLTGAIVAAIGLNLAGVAVKGVLGLRLRYADRARDGAAVGADRGACAWHGAAAAGAARRDLRLRRFI